jgi:ribosomal 50S subunit-associated protein YjgA (DUF615 family)
MIIHVNGVNREATEEEIAEIEASRAESKAEAKAKAKAEADRAKLKEETLTKLGLTAEEAAALFS